MIGSLVEEYQHINNSFKQKLVYRIGNRAGFFSEYNNMIFTMLYCLRNKIRFELHSVNSNISEKGWTEFFEPFCNENNQKWHIKYNHSWILPRPQKVINLLANYYYLFLCYFYNVDYVTSDLFHVARTQKTDDFIIIKDSELHGTFLEFCSELVQMTYKFNPETKKEIKNKTENLKIGEYVGFHIRRGDKDIEKEYNSLTEYIQKAERHTSLRNAFVATDDYSIICDLKRSFPEWQFHTLTKEIEKGYSYYSYSNMSHQEKHEHLTGFFAEIEVLTNATLFVGTFSSNVGIFLKMRRKNQPSIAVDYKDWLIW